MHLRSVLFGLSLIPVAACAAPVESTEPGAPLSSSLETGWIVGPDGAPQQVEYEVVDGVALFQGDIRLDHVMKHPHERAAFKPDWDWPGAVLPYVISPTLPAAQQSAINDAVIEYALNTPFRLVPWVPGYPDYLEFVPGTGCNSPVGRQGGAQKVVLSANCFRTETIHEIAHSIGFHHEQSRQDRDTYVDIHWDNIRDEMEYNFTKYNPSEGIDFGPYDIASIMHYQSVVTDPAFVFDPSKPVITAKGGGGYPVATNLSALDRAAMWRKAYVFDPLRDAWMTQQATVGFPLDRPFATADGLGQFVATERGRLYSHPALSGAMPVYGAIYLRYLFDFEADAGFLGLPTTPELPFLVGPLALDTGGRLSYFQHGAIAWSAATDARVIYGPVFDHWMALGATASFLGVPRTDVLIDASGSQYVNFEFGYIRWTPGIGAIALPGAWS